MEKEYNNSNSIQQTTEHRNYQSGSHSHHESGSHHHSSSYYSSRSHHSSEHHHHVDKSSEMERNGDNIIYKNVRKSKVFAMIKRTLFCIALIVLLIFTFSSIINSKPGESFSFFGSHTSKTEEIDELKSKLSQYEQRIEELEAELEQYKSAETDLSE